MRRFVWSFLSLALLGVVVVPSAAGAQPTCAPNEKLGACWQRFFDDHLKELKSNSGSKIVDKQIKQRPSTPDVPGTASQSSTKDFLPPFLAAIKSAQLDDKKQDLTLTWNLTAPPQVDVQLQSVVHQPQLFQALKDSLEASGRTARETALQSQLNDLDDFSTMLSLNLETQRFGRKFENYRALFFEPLFAEVVKRTDQFNQRQRDQVREDKNIALQMAGKELGKKPGDNPEDIFASEVSEATRNLVVADALAAAERDNELSRQLAGAHLDAFADLVDNQPQLTLTASQRHRNRNVGPDELLVQGSYEFSFLKLNTYRKWLANCGGPQACSGAQALAAYGGFLTKYGQSPLLRNGIKGKLSFEYSSINAYTLQLPADAVNIGLARAHRWSATFNLGGRVLYQGQNIGKLDFEARYENYSDQPAHRDRGIVDLTYTQKVSDSFSLPIGITYANHEQFLSDVQRKFSAHVALHAKIFGGQ